MPGRALVSLDAVIAWNRDDSDPDTTVLAQCLDAASDLFEEMTERRYLVSTFTETHDGDMAVGRDKEVLYTSAFPLTYPTDAVTVTENGTALVVGEGYAPNADVLVNACDGTIRKQRSTYAQTIADAGFPIGSGWCPGRQNITVTYKGGFDLAGIPSYVAAAVSEMTWFLYKAPRRTGLGSISKNGGSAQFLKDQADWVRNTIVNEQQALRPRTHAVVRIS